MNLEPKTLKLLEKLFAKFELSGQNADDYLEGLLVSNYEPYWKYIQLDSLLNLQHPKTDFPDEYIFITYHQITELYFNLIHHEISQIGEDSSAQNLALRMDRMIRYFNHLISSFDVMVDGMDHKQFNQFRMALLPASGFQSGQFRKIELCFTSLGQLLDPSMDKSVDRSFNDLYENIYWKKGAIDLKTGKKTLTLEQFEKEYDTQFIALAKEYESKNLRAEILKHEGKEGFADLRDKAKSLDVALNINWRLSHYRAAVRYLARAGDKSAGATGGTNWQKFLPPRFQKLVSFPEFWSKAELDEWGKNWVENELGL